MAVFDTDGELGLLGALIAAKEKHGDFIPGERAVVLMAEDLSHILLCDSVEEILTLKPKYLRMGVINQGRTLASHLDWVANNLDRKSIGLNFLEVEHVKQLEKFNANLSARNPLAQAAGIVTLVTLLKRHEELILNNPSDSLDTTIEAVDALYGLISGWGYYHTKRSVRFAMLSYFFENTPKGELKAKINNFYSNSLSSECCRDKHFVMHQVKHFVSKLFKRAKLTKTIRLDLI